MTAPRKSSLRFKIIAVILLGVTLVFAAPPRGRTVKKFSWPDAPVEIVGLMVKGKPVTFAKAFPTDDKWLGNLTVRIKNVSTRQVTWARVALKFLKQDEHGSQLTDLMTYGIGRTDVEKFRGGGPPLKPGETAVVSYSWEQYQSVREILDGMSYPRSVTKIELSVDEVIFENETNLMWIEGKMNKENTDRPGWSPIKP
jgi:hypothetical protein